METCVLVSKTTLIIVCVYNSFISRVATKLQSAYVLAKGGHMLAYLR